MEMICQSSRFNDEKCFQETFSTDFSCMQGRMVVNGRYAQICTIRLIVQIWLHDSKFQKNKIVLVALRSNALHVEWIYFTGVKKKL